MYREKVGKAKTSLNVTSVFMDRPISFIDEHHHHPPNCNDDDHEFDE